MKIRIAILLAGVSTLALAAAAHAQSPASPTSASGVAQIEEVVVTGSRVITNGNNSPTPVTVVSTNELRLTTPTTIADALNKLPSFVATGGVTRAGGGGGGGNAVGSYLSLRGFGANRNLILVDGRRAPPTSSDNSVDTNTLPELLTRRVDVVTGGASAVYGSDAVTGVVNYVLDHDFKGIKLEVQGGQSSRRDDGMWKFGIAAGGAFLDGRLHVEGSYEHYDSEGIDDKDARPWGRKDYCRTGAGTAANPFVFTTNCTYNQLSYGGRIVSGPGAGLSFSSNGILTPFVHGVPTGTGSGESGGEGTHGVDPTSLAAALKRDQAFGRLEYDVGNETHLFVQGAWSRVESHTLVYPHGGNIAPILYSTNNPFLTPAAQARLGGPNQIFGMYRPLDPVSFDNFVTTRNWSATVGLEGRVADRFNWNLYYTRAETELAPQAVRNMNIAKLYAALDAVRDPRTGNVVCSVSLNATTAAMYPGCVPINPFGPTAPGPGAWAYPEVTTSNSLRNRMDDLGGTIGGDLFNLPAGPVRFALSGEYRRMALKNRSDFRPDQTLQNTTGCVGINYGNCNPAGNTLLYIANTSQPMAASERIGEVAAEVTVPVLANVPFAKSLNLDGAVRWATYSESGQATTWKLGGTWEVTDGLMFRAARSRDIRAPTLLDLFGPVSSNVIGFEDPHTGVAGATLFQTRGNPNLVPEVAQTLTLGVVFRPSWAPRFSVAVDYYDIRMDQAISNVSGSATNVLLCNQSNGTSPLCALIVRPFPLSNTTPANYPTMILSSPLNIAKTWTHGVDAEVNYNFELPEASPVGGRVDLRLLATYQPVLKTQTLPGQPIFNQQGYANGNPVWRLALMAGYSNGPLSINVLERWRSSLKPDSNTSLVYAIKNPPAAAFTDLTVTYTFEDLRTKPSLFVAVNNLFDKQPGIWTQMPPVLVNFTNPTVNGDDVIGRYFTLGMRMKF